MRVFGHKSPTFGLRLLAAIALAASTVALAGGCSSQHVRVAAGLTGTPLDPPKAAPDAVLTNENDRPAHLLDRGAAATFLFFGYTHCPDECPLALASLGRADRKLPAATRERVRIVFVTVDPARDTPSVIKAYVRKFDRRMTGLTGSPAALARVWEAYGVTVDRTSHEIGHGDEIYAIDRSAHVVLVYPPDAGADDLAKDAAALATT